MTQKTAIIIPARMAASRLPGKPLADIGGEAMIVHVWRRACEADLGPVFVACDDTRIAEAINMVGGTAVLTKADHPSGTDRIYDALGQIDPEGDFDVIINLQGDLPTVEKGTLRACVAPFLEENSPTDIATVASVITNMDEADNPNVIKIVGSPLAEDRLKALYFTRSRAPAGEGPLFHHIGLYGFRRESLKKFVGLSPSTLERREKLEQLRALEAGMRIDVSVVDEVPLGVDTQEDLQRARKLLAERRK